jgi:3-deoxy-7-phosphoheptulonate synthase
MSIQVIEPMISPNSLKQELPIDPEIRNTVDLSRDIIRSMIHGNDDRLLVIVGPCSIHDPESAIEYA